MGLHLWMSTNHIVIHSYSPVGDFLLVIQCLLALLLIRQTFVKKSQTFRIFKFCFGLLFIAAVSNIAFYYTDLFSRQNSLLWILRAVYHISLLSLFCLYISYLKILIVFPEKTARKLSALSLGILLVFGTADILAPLTGWGFQQDHYGTWYEKMLLTPFMTGYLLYLAFILFLLIRYKRRLPTELFHMLLFTEAVCAGIVVLETSMNTTSFLATTYFLPLLVVLYMLHANAYDPKTGALGSASLDEYLRQQKHTSQDTYYLCLRFDMDFEYVVTEEMGKLFYDFWTDYFRKGMLFNPSTSFFVLAVDSHNIPDATERAVSLIKKVFQQYYEEYKLPYKLVLFDHLDFCENLEQFYDVFNYFSEKVTQNSYRVFGEEDYQSYKEMYYIRTQLKDIADHGSLDDERVLVYCQPVRNVHTGTYDTAESLMRLRLPQTGLVFPDRFIPLAEKYGYIHRLSMIILNKTCRQIRKIREEGYQISRVSVNLSVEELGEKDFMEEFKSIVQATGIDFHTIAVEFTETQNDTEYELVQECVNEFKKLGVCTYLDDFGTGYSNFDRILSLKLDVVKFDRSLLLMADQDANSRFLVSYFSAAFERLGYKVLYEGVETEEQEALCIASHADYLQGYKFSKPIPMEELPRFLTHV